MDKVNHAQRCVRTQTDALFRLQMQVMNKKVPWQLFHSFQGFFLNRVLLML